MEGRQVLSRRVGREHLTGKETIEPRTEESHTGTMGRAVQEEDTAGVAQG